MPFGIISDTQCFITKNEIYTFYYSSALLSHKSLHMKKEDSLLNLLNNCYGELYEDNRTDVVYLITKGVSVCYIYFTFRTKLRTSHATVSFYKGLSNRKFSGNMKMPKI